MANINDVSDDEDAGAASGAQPNTGAQVGSDDLDIVETRPERRPVEADERLSSEQRADSGDEDDDEETRRARNREIRHEKRDRQRRAMARDKTELNYLRQRNEEMERRLASVEQTTQSTRVSGIDSSIQREESQLAQADELLGAAVEAKNGGDVVKLTRIRDTIRDKIRELKDDKVSYERENTAASTRRETAAPVRETAQPAVDPMVKQNATVFYNRHKSWYDPAGKNQDSKIVYAIDNAVQEDGFDPRTREYWEELEKRCAKVLPQRFRAGGNQSTPRDYADDDVDDDLDDDTPAEPQARTRPAGGPRMPQGGNSRGGGGGGNRRYHISPERRQAMELAGVWDDPVLRQKYAKKYQEWDKANASSRSN